MPRSNHQSQARVDLRIVTDLVNTRKALSRSEQLGTPVSTSHWLISQNWLPADTEVSEPQHQRLIALREGLIDLLYTSGARWDADAAARLNEIVRGARLEAHFDLDGLPRLDSAARNFDELFGKIVSLIVAAYFTDQWKRLKICVSGECRIAFYDDSKSSKRRWCTRRCGDVMRSRAYRRTARYRR